MFESVCFTFHAPPSANTADDKFCMPNIRTWKLPSKSYVSEDLDKIGYVPGIGFYSPAYDGMMQDLLMILDDALKSRWTLTSNGCIQCSFVLERLSNYYVTQCAPHMNEFYHFFFAFTIPWIFYSGDILRDVLSERRLLGVILQRKTHEYSSSTAVSAAFRT